MAGAAAAAARRHPARHICRSGSAQSGRDSIFAVRVPLTPSALGSGQAVQWWDHVAPGKRREKERCGRNPPGTHHTGTILSQWRMEKGDPKAAPDFDVIRRRVASAAWWPAAGLTLIHYVQLRVAQQAATELPAPLRTH